MKKVFVGLSGGVDSAVSAALHWGVIKTKYAFLYIIHPMDSPQSQDFPVSVPRETASSTDSVSKVKNKKSALVLLAILGLVTVLAVAATGFVAFTFIRFIFIFGYSFESIELNLLIIIFIFFPLGYILPYVLAFYFYNKQDFTASLIISSFSNLSFLLVTGGYLLFPFIISSLPLLYLLTWGLLIAIPVFILWKIYNARNIQFFYKFVLTYFAVLLIIFGVGLFQEHLKFQPVSRPQGHTRDQQRMANLADLRTSISLYAYDYGYFPPSLDDLDIGYLIYIPVDPLTGKSYEYTLIEDSKTYSLCAKMEEYTSDKYCIEPL